MKVPVESGFVPQQADAGVRVERFARGSDFSAVARLLGERRDEILRRWLSAVGQQPFMRGAAEQVAIDHIPELYDALTALLRRRAPRTVDPEAPLDDAAVLRAAEAHALERLDQGLRATDVVTEFRLLRQEIGRALRLALAELAHDREEAQFTGPGQAAPEDVVAAELLVHDALDGAVGLALAALTERAELAVMRLEASLAAEKEARAAADMARDWADFMAQAGQRLSESLDGEATLANVAGLAVPRLAEWCTVYVVGEDGEPRRLAAAHAEPEKDALLKALLRFPVTADPAHPVRRAIKTQQPVHAPPPEAGAADRYATDDEHARLLRELGTGGALIVPLVARGQSVGAISAGRSPSQGEVGVDSALMVELARRAALALDNARLYREAQEAVRVRDDVLATVSHDLRTPLAAVSGQAQLIERDATRESGPAAERRARRAAMIVGSARRMTAMVDELLDVARLRAGQRLELLREPVELVGLARRVAAEQQRQSQAHQVLLEATPPEILGEWDGTRLERVVANLIGNAIKYSPLGGEVRVSLAQRGDEAMVGVHDAGIGIAPEDFGRIFEPFQRVSRTSGGQIEGQGVGLASARQIVEAHGGTISVESSPGAGSTFTVRLPLGRAATG